jgi:hypothetical protein
VNSLPLTCALLKDAAACASPSVWPSLDTAYWLAGAIAEVFGALFALTGIFVIYKLQTIDRIGAKEEYYKRAHKAEEDATPRWGLARERAPEEDQPVSRSSDLRCRTNYKRLKSWLVGLGKDNRAEVRSWAEVTLYGLRLNLGFAEAADREREQCTRLAFYMAAANGFTIVAALAALLAAEALGKVLGTALVMLLAWSALVVTFNVWSIVRALRGADEELQNTLADAAAESASCRVRPRELTQVGGNQE